MEEGIEGGGITKTREWNSVELFMVINTHHTHPHTHLPAVSLTISLSSPSENECCLSW